jgi:hypothetical protein
MYLTKKMTVFKRTILWLSAIGLTTLVILISIGLQVRETIRANMLKNVH